MSRARDFADLAGSADAGGLTGRNLIINGAMQVAQRGTSEIGVTSGKYPNACDRYRVNGNNGTWTVSQDTDAPAGFSNSLKFLLTATEAIGGTSYWSVEQRIEGQNLQGLAYGTSSAKTVTLSFYVKSNVTGTYCLNLFQDDGSKNFPKTYTIDSANTWERKTISFEGDTATALDNDNAKSLRPQFHMVAGSSYTSGTPGSRGAYSDATFAAGHTAQIDAVNDYFQITGVQLEVGEKATPFEHRSFGDELRRCQRYFQGQGTTAAALDASGDTKQTQLFFNSTLGFSSGATHRLQLNMQRDMRAAPTIYISDNNGNLGKAYWSTTNTTASTYLATSVSAALLLTAVTTSSSTDMWVNYSLDSEL